MVAIGTLKAVVKLDNPHQIYHGSGDPVTGNVVLTFTPSQKSREDGTTELFAHMSVMTSLHGRAKTKVKINSGNSRHVYRGRVPLIERKMKIHDDSLRIERTQAMLIPFSYVFPERWDHPVTGDWKVEDKTFDTSQGQMLPPSFEREYSGFSENHFECFVAYRIGVNVSVRHLAVDVITQEEDAEPLVCYSLPRLPARLDERVEKLSNRVHVSNELLLPEEDRPAGFRQKMKATLRSNQFPNYTFNWTMLMPRNLYIGQPAAFEIYIRPREEECTAILIPDVTLSGFSVNISGWTHVRAERGIFTTPSSDHEDSIGFLKCNMDNKGPFSKAANDWTKIINTEPVPNRVGCTFKTVNIAQQHLMRVRLNFNLAGKSFNYEKGFPVVVHPPLQEFAQIAGPSSSDVMAGSSSQPYNMQPVAEALPRYEEGLPQYDEVTAGGSAPSTSLDKSITTDEQLR